MTVNHVKLKIFILIVLVVIVIVTIIAFASKDQQHPPSTIMETEIKPENASGPSDVAQQTGNIAQKHSNDSENTIEAKQILPEAKLRELEGHINKEYGIREDILRFIEKEIPPENAKAKKAAIRNAELSNFIYYHANQKEALEADQKEAITLDCLGYALPDQEWLKISRGINKLMRDTQERDEHMWDIDKRYFGWKILGNGGLTDKQVKVLCESGDY